MRIGLTITWRNTNEVLSSAGLNREVLLHSFDGLESCNHRFAKSSLQHQFVAGINAHDGGGGLGRGPCGQAEDAAGAVHDPKGHNSVGAHPSHPLQPRSVGPA